MRRSFVGPRVSVSEGATIGAGAVLTGDEAPWVVMVGNRAEVLEKPKMRSPADIRDS